MSNMYFQCRLTRNEEAGGKVVVQNTKGWIAARGAVVDATVELLTGDGEFWTVVEVYTPGMEFAALQAKQARDRGALPSLVNV